MLRPILQLFTITITAVALAMTGQMGSKIDVNLASATELQRLPGIHAAEAKRILASRPYAKAADLHRAGLSDAEINHVKPLIAFGHRQQEIPSRQGGMVVEVDPSLLEPCNLSHSAATPMEITSARLAGQTTVCVPREWFSPDGHTLTAVGENQITHLTWSLSREPVKDVSVVTLTSANSKANDRAWTNAAADLLVKRVDSYPRKYAVQRVTSPSSSPKMTDDLNVLQTAYFDANKVSDTLVLVVPISATVPHPPVDASPAASAHRHSPPK